MYREYEYKTILFLIKNETEKFLNELGDEGWKLCGINHDLFIFVREKDGEPKDEELAF